VASRNNWILTALAKICFQSYSDKPRKDTSILVGAVLKKPDFLGLSRGAQNVWAGKKMKALIVAVGFLPLKAAGLGLPENMA